MAVLPAVTTVIPLFPPSEDPMASVITRLGRWTKNWSLTGAENSAADDTTASERREVVVGAPGSSSDSISGLPMASPVIITEFTCSSPTSRQTSWGSNLAIRTIFEPTKLWPMTHHWVAPCMSGATGRWVIPPPAPLATMTDGSVIRCVRDGVRAAAEGVEDVLVAPDHALGHAGRPAGVEDVEVVARSRPEVALGRLARQRILVADRVRGRLGVAAVLDHDDVAQLGQLGERAPRPAARTPAGGPAPSRSALVNR